MSITFECETINVYIIDYGYLEEIRKRRIGVVIIIYRWVDWGSGFFEVLFVFFDGSVGLGS